MKGKLLRCLITIFANITDALGIKEITENISSVSGLVDPIDIAIKNIFTSEH